MIVAIVDDLLFGSKIRAAAEAAGRRVTFVRHGGRVEDAARVAGASLVIVDLAGSGAADAIRAVRALEGPRIPIVAFASHLRADLIAEARAAGADRVLARSAFVTELPTLVTGSGAAAP
jgi:DNA-binding NarL/FixJ family response regulator